MEAFREAVKYKADGAGKKIEELKRALDEKAAEFNRLGLTAYAGGDLKKAAEYFEKALRHNPEMDEARENLSRVRRELE